MKIDINVDLTPDTSNNEKVGCPVDYLYRELFVLFTEK